LEGDISRLIDLSRYEVPANRSDDFRARMAVNIVALFLLVTLAAAAAIDVVDIEEIKQCSPAWQCGAAAICGSLGSEFAMIGSTMRIGLARRCNEISSAGTRGHRISVGDACFEACARARHQSAVQVEISG
jgi:hypothetical protein